MKTNVELGNIEVVFYNSFHVGSFAHGNLIGILISWIFLPIKQGSLMYKEKFKSQALTLTQFNF